MIYDKITVLFITSKKRLYSTTSHLRLLGYQIFLVKYYYPHVVMIILCFGLWSFVVYGILEMMLNHDDSFR